MARPLLTRAQTEAAHAAERTTRGQGRVTRAAAHFATLAGATPAGMAVRARVVANPEQWAMTAIACDTHRLVAVLEHADGLYCPVCGTRYDRIPGAGIGPVEPDLTPEPPRGGGGR